MKRKLLLRDLDVLAFLGIAIIHAFAFCAPWYFTWSGLWIAVALAWLSGWIGITMCYHRLLTHKSFETWAWFRYVLTTIGTLAWQGGPITWVGNHRLHHTHSDTDRDPHTPQHGFAWAHVFWTLFKNPEGQDPRSVTKDLLRDRTLVLIDRFFWVPQVVLALGLFLGGLLLYDLHTAFSWIVWGVGVRTAFVYHGTWFVNSAGHTWGYRNFKTHDSSTNNWWVAFLSGGEGWHNNHHAQQRSAAHGMRWYEIDPTYRMIKLLSLIGLAWDVIEPDKPGRSTS